ncbi:NAD(P)-dependent oxidoreductase [Actinoplanes utahensis]|uniref:D-isomer specific 2-hydroxyacid dehydrogenase NAD-binding domain-containing protein n=1 Tax=Actinoplanes utahensis TaxID=1869 RepID=A0A0A6UND1_ACTUT|nr:NAD(P)-dependent oxidoreductase [Actinoplanes utahensis]KHD75794.1 hypothetical protein MB27_20315 [Actinoplanes utahensis]GIF32183.1 hypothetical protein Aut01nite_51690 [Actinoplanes utahensis]
MPSTVFHQISVLPGVWASPGLLDRLRPLSRRQPLVLDAWPHDDSDTGRSFARTDAVLAGWKDTLDADRLGRLPDLRYIGLRATSTGRVDLDYAGRHGITVAPIEGYGDAGTVEFVTEQLLRHARHGGEARGELAGRRLGIVGYGRVGRAVGRVAQALGMDVAFHTPTARTAAAGEPRWSPLPELLASADLLTFHSPAYRHAVRPDQLRLIPDGTFVVITTLGLPMDAAALRSWQSARGGRVVLDLCAADGLPGDLRDLPGLEIHDLYAARTADSVRRAEAQVLANLAAALTPHPAGCQCCLSGAETALTTSRQKGI